MQSIEEVINFLNAQALSVTTAESCTAGMIASKMADVSGCGKALQSGFVVYTPEAKHSCLGVNFETIKNFGLTSEEVAREMAIGALTRSAANLVVATTGTAESDDQLNGVICFAFVLATEHGYCLSSESKSFDGSRNQVREAAATHALLSLPGIYQKLKVCPEIYLL